MVVIPEFNLTAPVTPNEDKVTPLDTLNWSEVEVDITELSVPKAPEDPATKIPPLATLAPPLYVFVPVKVKAPLFPLASTLPVPEITPDKVCAVLDADLRIPLLVMVPAYVPLPIDPEPDSLNVPALIIVLPV